jgi:hypothetical protein
MSADVSQDIQAQNLQMQTSSDPVEAITTFTLEGLHLYFKLRCRILSYFYFCFFSTASTENDSSSSSNTVSVVEASAAGNFFFTIFEEQ